MFIKNAQIFRLDQDWGMTSRQLDQLLSKKKFIPCGSQDMESRGWVTPDKSDSMVMSVGGHWLLSLCFEQKLLPGAVVSQEAAERAEAIEHQQGYKPGRKQMKEIKEAVLQELLPRAFSRRTLVHVWIDPKGGWLVVDAASRSRAEDVITTLREAVEDLPVRNFQTQLSPMSAMADWLASGEAPADFNLENDFSLKSVSDDKAEATFKRHDFEAAHVRDHLKAGKLPTKLAMTFNDRVSFVLTEKGEVKRIEMLDVVKETLLGAGESAEEIFEAEFALMAGELSELFDALVDALGGELVGDGEEASEDMLEAA